MQWKTKGSREWCDVYTDMSVFVFLLKCTCKARIQFVSHKDYICSNNLQFRPFSTHRFSATYLHVHCNILHIIHASLNNLNNLEEKKVNHSVNHSFN